MDLDLIHSGLGGVGDRWSWDPEGMRSRAEATWDPEIVYEEAPGWPGAGTFRGADAIIARFEEYSEALGEMELEVESIDEVDENRALAIIHAHARSVAGVPVDRRWAPIFTVEGSKVTHWRAEMDPERARRDLGLDPA